MAVTSKGLRSKYAGERGSMALLRKRSRPTKTSAGSLLDVQMLDVPEKVSFIPLLTHDIGY